MGLFSESINNLGEDKFRDKYCFNLDNITYKDEINEDIERGIEESKKAGDPLRK